MKKITVIIASMVLCATAANAQSGLFDLLKGSATQSVAEALLGAVTGQQNIDLTGTWIYQGVAADVVSENLFGSLASKAAMGTVESKCDEALAKVGIKPGVATLTFDKDYKFYFKVGKLSIPGTWTQEDDKVTIKFGKALTFMQLDGIVKSSTGGCEVLFEADKFLKFAEKAIAIIGNISGNSLVSSLGSVVSNAKGLDAGFKLSK